MDLTEHFSLEELTRSKPGIPNDTSPVIIVNLSRVAEKLEQARAIWGVPVRISYGYRCQALNDAVGSQDTSAHLDGLAADAIPQGLNLREAWERLISDPEFMADVDQLIIERGCVHIGLATARHGGIPRCELRLDQDIDGVRHYPLYGIWTPQGVVRG